MLSVVYFLHISIYIKLEKQLTADNPKHEVKWELILIFFNFSEQGFFQYQKYWFVSK